jgi:hypothetical protein
MPQFQGPSQEDAQRWELSLQSCWPQSCPGNSGQSLTTSQPEPRTTLLKAFLAQGAS